MPAETKKDFFISYNKADRGWAEWIAWQLEEAGYTTVVQAWDFRPGGNFVSDMQRAATGSERTIAVLSPDYLTSKFTEAEWAAAFAQDPTGEKGILLPVRVRECELKGLLPQIVYVDLVGKSETPAKTALLAGVRRGRAKPDEKPEFPPEAQRSVEKKPRFPGALPSIWNVSHNRNPNFTGREDFLSALSEALTSGQPAALTQAIHGLGGVGKTQLATEYAYRNAHLYDIVWSVRAEEPATLAADYAGLAARLGLAEANEQNQSIIVQAVRNWLGQNGGWLLIFDNANRRDEIRDYLPQGNTGHVIITSRDREWRGVAHPLQVREMPRRESVEFLLKRTSQDDEDSASALADELGDLPLALEQAGAYIDATSETLAAYLQLFREHHERLLSRGEPSTNYPATVATTWDISFAEVRKQSPVSEDLMNLCAFFAPDDIPLDVIRDGASHLPEPLAAAVPDPISLDDALTPILRYSLAERRGQGLFIHRLVQAVVREHLSQEATKLWAVAAARILNGAFPNDSFDVRIWPACSGLVPHALSATQHAEKFQEAYRQLVRLLNELGIYMRARADYGGARAVLERATMILKSAGSEDDGYMATTLTNLGTVLRIQNDLAGARSCHERSVDINKRVYGEEHPSVGHALNNLGAVLKMQGDLDGARIQFERAIELYEAAYGEEHHGLSTCISNLGLVLQEQGDLVSARACFERAIKIDEKMYGKEHPKVAIHVDSLGCLLYVLGDLEGARDCLEQALKILNKFLGEEHPDTLITKENLVAVLAKLGKT